MRSLSVVWKVVAALAASSCVVAPDERARTLRAGPEVDDGAFLARAANVPYPAAWVFYDHRAEAPNGADYETLISLAHPAMNLAQGFESFAAAIAPQQPWSIQWVGPLPNDPETDPTSGDSIDAVMQWTWDQYRDAIPASSTQDFDVRLVQRWEYLPGEPVVHPPGFEPPSSEFEYAIGVLPPVQALPQGPIYELLRNSHPQQVVAYVWVTPRCGLEIWALRVGEGPDTWNILGEDEPGVSLKFVRSNLTPMFTFDACTASAEFHEFINQYGNFVVIEHRYFTPAGSRVACLDQPPNLECGTNRTEFPGPVWVRTPNEQAARRLVAALFADAPETSDFERYVRLNGVVWVRIRPDELNRLLAVDPPYLIEPSEPMLAGGSIRHNSHSHPSSREFVPRGVQDVCAPEAWRHADGRGVRIAVLDTGIDCTRDLEGAIDCAAQWPKIRAPGDPHGHGTLVASTIAARENGWGVVGVAKRATLIDVQVLDRTGRGNDDDLVNGIRHAIKPRECGGGGADVLVMALEGRTAQMPTKVKDALLDARACGVLVIAAAGNRRERISWPASFDKACLSIGAIARIDDEVQTRRCSGQGDESFASAPGYATPGYYVDAHGREHLAYIEGTSAAAAHAAGVAAVAIQANSGWRTRLLGRAGKKRVDELRDILEDCVSPRTYPWILWWAKTDDAGEGLLNACRTIPGAKCCR